jgi:ribosome-associated protein
MATKKKAPAKKAFGKKAPVKRPAAKGVANGGAKGGAKKGGKAWYPAGPAPTSAGRGRKAAAPKKAAAPRAAPRPSPPAARPDPVRPLALAIAKAGLDKKAEDVLLLDVRGLTSYADYFVVMTADSDRQAGAIADHVEEQMKKAGVTKVGVEGYEGGRWILVDYGDVVAHVMNREAREFYDLEGLWADAPRIQVAG